MTRHESGVFDACVLSRDKRGYQPNKYKDMRTISITTITKRDGTLQDFDLKKIAEAIYKALKATESGTEEDANTVAAKVHEKIVTMCARAA